MKRERRRESVPSSPAAPCPKRRPQPQSPQAGWFHWRYRPQRTRTGEREHQGCPEGKMFAAKSTRSAVLRWGHSSRLVAHPGVGTMLAAFRQRFWWPAMTHNVCRFEASYSVCVQHKPSNSFPVACFDPFPFPPILAPILHWISLWGLPPPVAIR